MRKLARDILKSNTRSVQEDIYLSDRFLEYLSKERKYGSAPLPTTIKDVKEMLCEFGNKSDVGIFFHHTEDELSDRSVRFVKTIKDLCYRTNQISAAYDAGVLTESDLQTFTFYALYSMVEQSRPKKKRKNRITQAFIDRYSEIVNLVDQMREDGDVKVSKSEMVSLRKAGLILTKVKEG